MPRRPRRATGGFVFHVMNRGARRLPLFEADEDYRLFLNTLRDAQARVPLRLLSYVLMPNHWHLVVWPEHDEELSRFMAWATGTHSRRWHRHHGTVGTGTIYQGRYKAIPVKDDFHFLIVCRYVERNPIAAGLARRSTDWPWSSAARRRGLAPVLSAWPVPVPEHWRQDVDAVQAPGEFDELRADIRHVRPFGPSTWQCSGGRPAGDGRSAFGREAGRRNSRGQSETDTAFDDDRDPRRREITKSSRPQCGRN